LLLEVGQPEKAEEYIASSSAIASANNLNNIELENHLLLSKMERSRGRHEVALQHIDRYNILKDSLFSADKLANINQLQRVREISKANRQVERMTVEQKIKERTINYQKIILFIAFGTLLLLGTILLFVFRQNKKLNRAYRALVEKNLKIMELQESSSRQQPKSTPYLDSDGELSGRILAIMEDSEVICNPKFSINVLSSLVEANHTYVSQVINTTLHKNFRALLNEYRIREAQRLLAKSDAAKYTIESISLQLGYKSPNTFRAAFAEITGVTPGFYLKSVRESINGNGGQPL
jgi:AraC-like DNA-binding protein